MLKIIYANAFKRDFKKIKSQKDLSELKEILSLLTNEKQLSIKCRPHPLIGDYSRYNECHIKPDLLLLYSVDEETLYLYRIGSHSSLFK